MNLMRLFMSTLSNVKPEYNDIISSLEDIVRGEGDDTLNIPSFLQRIMASIEANGTRFTETCYGLPSYLVRNIEEYMQETY